MKTNKLSKVISIFEVLWYESHNCGTVVMGRQSNKFLQLRHHGFGSYFQIIIYGVRQLWITCKLVERCLKISGSCWYHQGA